MNVDARRYAPCRRPARALARQPPRRLRFGTARRPPSSSPSELAARARTKVRDTFKFPGNTLILRYIHRATPRTRPPCDFGRCERRRKVVISNGPGVEGAEVRRSSPPTRHAFGPRLGVDDVTRGRRVAPTSRDCVGAAGGARCEQRCERQRRPGRRKGLRGSAGRFARPASGLPALRSATGTMGKLSAVRFARVPPRGTSCSPL